MKIKCLVCNIYGNRYFWGRVTAIVVGFYDFGFKTKWINWLGNLDAVIDFIKIAHSIVVV